MTEVKPIARDVLPGGRHQMALAGDHSYIHVQVQQYGRAFFAIPGMHGAP